MLSEGAEVDLLKSKPSRTPEWPGYPEEEDDDVPSSTIAPEDFSGKSLSHRQDLAEKFKPQKKTRTKVKTRPAEQPAERDAASKSSSKTPRNPEEEIPRQQLNVDKRAKGIFEMLFYQPLAGKTQLPGEIHWRDFLYAMHNAGFSVKKLGGSSWQFTPDPSCGYARSIQFHEPHPEPNISVSRAKFYSRRLAKTYNWCAETFGEEDKTKEVDTESR